MSPEVTDAAMGHPPPVPQADNVAAMGADSLRWGGGRSGAGLSLGSLGDLHPFSVHGRGRKLNGLVDPFIQTGTAIFWYHGIDRRQ